MDTISSSPHLVCVNVLCDMICLILEFSPTNCENLLMVGMHDAGVLPGISEEGECGQEATALRDEPQQVPGLPVPHPVPRAGKRLYTLVLVSSITLHASSHPAPLIIASPA